MIRGRGCEGSVGRSEDGFGDELMRVSKNTLILVLVAGFRVLGANTVRWGGASRVKVMCDGNIAEDSSSSSISSASDRACCIVCRSEGKCNGFTGNCNKFAAILDIGQIRNAIQTGKVHAPVPNFPHSPPASCTESRTNTSAPI